MLEERNVSNTKNREDGVDDAPELGMRPELVQILFVCVHNSGRSQMAEAWFNHLAMRRHIAISAASAGTKPATAVQPLVARAMAERGLDISLKIPRLLTDEMVGSAGKVVTMGCGIDSDSCPSIRYKNSSDWNLQDPSKMSIEEIRILRDQIRDEVEKLLTYLTRPVAT